MPQIEPYVFVVLIISNAPRSTCVLFCFVFIREYEEPEIENPEASRM